MIFLRIILIQVISFSILFISCKEEEELVLKIEEKPNQVELFGADIISTQYYERDIAISPNGDEIIYSLADYKQRLRCLVSIKKDGEYWTKPKILNISGEYHDIEPFFAENGNKLFFASNRPIVDSSLRSDYNIWYSNRNEQGWDKAIALDTIINTNGDEYYPSVSNNGNLYFTATKDIGFGLEDIYISKFENGRYLKPEALDSAINTKTYEFNAFINSDETIIIFSSYGRKDGFGGGDLYYSKKDKNGKWMKSVNMGKDINSEKLDYCPFIDENRGNFYYTSEKVIPLNEKINTIESLKNFSNQIQNGLGNIYRVNSDLVFK